MYDNFKFIIIIKKIIFYYYSLLGRARTLLHYHKNRYLNLVLQSLKKQFQNKGHNKELQYSSPGDQKSQWCFFCLLKGYRIFLPNINLIIDKNIVFMNNVYFNFYNYLISQIIISFSSCISIGIFIFSQSFLDFPLFSINKFFDPIFFSFIIFVKFFIAVWVNSWYLIVFLFFKFFDVLHLVICDFEESWIPKNWNGVISQEHDPVINKKPDNFFFDDVILNKFPKNNWQWDRNYEDKNLQIVVPF